MSKEYMQPENHPIWLKVKQSGFILPSGYWNELREHIIYQINEIDLGSESESTMSMKEVNQDAKVNDHIHWGDMQDKIWLQVHQHPQLIEFTKKTGMQIPDGFFEKQKNIITTQFINYPKKPSIILKSIGWAAAACLLLSVGMYWISSQEKNQITNYPIASSDTVTRPPLHQPEKISAVPYPKIQMKSSSDLVPAVHEIQLYLEENPDEIILEEL